MLIKKSHNKHNLKNSHFLTYTNIRHQQHNFVHAFKTYLQAELAREVISYSNFLNKLRHIYYIKNKLLLYRK